VGSTVLLVDDVEEVRSVVCQALRRRGGFDVVTEAGDGGTAIAAAREHQPDIVVLDLGLPDLAGSEVLARLQAAAPAAQVVIYTGMLGEELAAPQPRVTAVVQSDDDVHFLVDLVSNLGHDIGAGVELGPDLADVARARRFIGERCAQWGCDDGLEDDAELVATELVTNALVHASTRCHLRARLLGGMLHIEVEDSGAGTPDVQAADDRSEHGRGLLIVSALCTAWGVEARPPTGKRVWAQLRTAPPGAGRRRAPTGTVAPR
jgi:CheY-like chemotaxis protein/anti-sigma regulatory factor (Ser/Thr protein kinase)